MAGLEKAFGSALRELRNQRALSQEALAFEAELARNYISQLELGSKSCCRRPKTDSLKGLVPIQN